AAALALALLAPAFVRRSTGLSRGGARVVIVIALVVGLALSGALAPGNYGHVRAVLWAKLRLLGRFPADPTEIPFDARLLWQGRFATLPFAHLLDWSGWPLALLFALACATAIGVRGAGGFERLALALTLAGAGAAWAFGRLAVLVGYLAPIAACIALARWRA